jgi:hypothetical protein
MASRGNALRPSLWLVLCGLSAQALLPIGLGAQTAAPAPVGPALVAAIDDRLRTHGDEVTAAVWLGGASGDAWFVREAEAPRASASAIKTFYLVELFARYAGALDQPLPGVAPVLAADAHPALSHFTPEQRAEIRRDLAGASVRRVGLVMMGTAPASNVVYNAAANLTTAALGGPDALTAAIRARDRAFAGVAARRYMLRDRTERGDNEAPAAALAVAYQRLASRSLAGIDAATMDAIHAALRRADDPVLGRRFDKDGSLASDPLCEIRAGWYETPRGPLVYVVMTRQPTPGGDGREASSQRLARTAQDLAQTIVQAGAARLAVTSSTR